MNPSDWSGSGPRTRSSGIAAPVSSRRIVPEKSRTTKRSGRTNDLGASVHASGFVSTSGNSSVPGSVTVSDQLAGRVAFAIQLAR